MQSEPKYFYNPSLDTIRFGKTLPHWKQEDTIIFLTWRLWDSVPKVITQKWMDEIRNRRELKPTSPIRSNELELDLFENWDQRLDRGTGSCLLKDPKASKILKDALSFYHGTHYLLLNFAIMPTHLHLLYLPKIDKALESQIRQWKSYTSRELNKLLNLKGPVWQKGYWDRLMRNPIELYRVFRYIKQNPAKAGIAPGEFLYWENPALPEYLTDILADLLRPDS
jgi:type I restriction enzyme R subunit